jgi:SAM-dependent methyltransferase
MPKIYDRAYYDKWYRGPGRVTSFNEMRRKVTTVVANTEYFLRRPLKNVLDIGCGEAPWFVHLKAMRARVSYVGVDPSEYVVRAFARHRNVHRGGFTDLSETGTGKFDLVVCSDVMHYLTDAEIRDGLPDVVGRMRGLAFFEVFTKEDHIYGDIDGYNRRPAKWYRDAFRKVGLTQVAPYMWIAPSLADEPSELERLG